MKRESSGPILTTVFVDYDNVYLSLKRKSEEAAKRFSKDAGLWIQEIASGALMTPTNAPALEAERRIVINRCYGNPVPRRNQSDNSTDMSSFPFVRHHFLRAGFEVVDCPPLTAQLKNSADIRMVMDVRDMPHPRHLLRRIRHPSGRCRLHAGAAPAALARAAHGDLLQRSHGGALHGDLRRARFAKPTSFRCSSTASSPTRARRQRDRAARHLPSAASIEALRTEILTEVVNLVRAADQPVPLEALADRCVRVLGHEKTVGAAWGGTGASAIC